VIAIGWGLLLASCSARVAASLLARNVATVDARAGSSDLGLRAALARRPPDFTYAVRIAASHASLFVLLLLLARYFSDSGNTRLVTCAYLCVGVAVAGQAIWVIGRVFAASAFWTRVRTRARWLALVHATSWLASLLMLAVAAALIVPVPAAGG